MALFGPNGGTREPRLQWWGGRGLYQAGATGGGGAKRSRPQAPPSGGQGGEQRANGRGEQPGDYNRNSVGVADTRRCVRSTRLVQQNSRLWATPAKPLAIPRSGCRGGGQRSDFAARDASGAAAAAERDKAAHAARSQRPTPLQQGARPDGQSGWVIDYGCGGKRAGSAARDVGRRYG